MEALGVAVAFWLGGALLGANWRHVMRLAAIPGSLIAGKEKSETEAERGVGASKSALVVTVLAQLYVSLIYVAFVVESARSFASRYTGFGPWLIWGAALSVSVAMPLIWAPLDREKDVQPEDYVALLSAIGALIFALVPQVVQTAWGWVPHF